MFEWMSYGWVHRDVSTGNILIDGNDEVRLADLEYAKRLNDTSSHDVRTVSTTLCPSLHITHINLKGYGQFHGC